MTDWTIPPADHTGVYVDLVRDLEPEAGKLVRNQHVTSKVLLKGFAGPGPSGKGWMLTPFDLHRRQEQRTRGLNGCGKIPDFLTYASASAERIWKTVEDKLPDAIRPHKSAVCIGTGRLRLSGTPSLFTSSVPPIISRCTGLRSCGPPST